MAFLALIWAPIEANAISIYSDKAAFLTATGALDATGAFPDLGVTTPQPVTLGSITFSAPAPSSVAVGTFGHGITDWTTLLPGNDLAINDVENLNIVASGSLFSMGFDFVEPSLGGSTTNTCFVATCTDSTFTIEIVDGGTVLGSVLFSPDNDVAAFFGIRSDVAFDQLRIRETTGGIDDEYWGHIYIGNSPNQVPEPSVISLLGLPLLWLVASQGRRRVTESDLAITASGLTCRSKGRAVSWRF